MPRFASISFHPKFVAILDALLGVLMLWWLRQINSWWLIGVWFAFRIFFWFWQIRLVYYPPEVNRWRHFFSLAFFNLGMLGFLLFTEWSWAWRVVSLVYVFIPFISFWLLPSSRIGIAALFKPHRRWRFVMALVSVAGLFEVVGAMFSFQIASYQISPWIWIAAAAFAVTVLAGWWWWEYGIIFFHDSSEPSGAGAKMTLSINSRTLRLSAVWLIAFFVLLMELQWVFFLLPLGYQTNGLALTWCWYILWIFGRFHLSSEGIKWDKQRLSLSVALLFFIVFFVFAVRWK